MTKCIILEIDGFLVYSFGTFDTFLDGVGRKFTFVMLPKAKKILNGEEMLVKKQAKSTL